MAGRTSSTLATVAEAVFVALVATVLAGLALLPSTLIVGAPSVTGARIILPAVACFAFGFRLGEGRRGGEES